MKVIELIIDGFKSYAVRTVISGWDESFNSITGLNGSGKSNILDAICFVLGITSMSTVRAQNIQVCGNVEIRMGEGKGDGEGRREKGGCWRMAERITGARGVALS